MSKGFGLVFEVQIFKEDAPKASESSISSVNFPQLSSQSIKTDSECDEKRRGRRN
jgi:hypothetical protein